MTILKGKKVLCIMPIPIIPLIGTSIRCMRQIRGLIENGMEVTLLCPEIMEPDGKNKLSDPFFEGVKVLSILPNNKNAILRELGTLFISRRKIENILRELNPDIVHVHNPPDTMPFVASLACSSMKIPMIYDIHDAALETINAVEFNPILKMLYLRITLFFEKQAVRRSKGLLFVSENAKKSFIDTRKYLKHYLNNIHVIVMKNTDPGYSKIKLDENQDTENYIFYSGTLYSNLIGLEEFIDAFAEVTKEVDIKFLIAGDGPYRARLMKYVEQRGLTDRVRFLGFVDRWDIKDSIIKAKLCAIPYRDTPITRITLPHKVFEYMAYGKAIIHPDFPGFAEVLESDNPGKYISGDRNTLVKILKKFLSDDKLREKVGKHNKDLLKRISFETELSKMISLYERLLSAV
jgi:glycosyltransferase involved in cell wall biosynthesis